MNIAIRSKIILKILICRFLLSVRLARTSGETLKEEPIEPVISMIVELCVLCFQIFAARNEYKTMNVMMVGAKIKVKIVGK